MANGGRIAVAGAVVLALLVLVTWWLLPSAGEGELPGDASAVAHQDAAPLLPVAEGGDLRALEAAAPTNGLVEAEPAAAPPPPPGVEVAFTGRVVDESGRPVPGAEVIHVASGKWIASAGWSDGAMSYFQAQPWERFERATTDTEGRFLLPSREAPAPRAPMIDARSGRNSIHQTADGRLPRLLVQHPAFELATFQVPAWSRGAGEVGDLVVKPGSAVQGRLVDDDGQPIAGASVALAQVDEAVPTPPAWGLVKAVPRTETGPDGRFWLGSLWTTTLKLELLAEGRAPLRREVLLQAGEVADLQDIVIPRGLALAGLVFDEHGAPIAGAEILARMDSISHGGSGPDAAAAEAGMRISYGGDAYELRTTSDAAGAFRITGVRDERLAWSVIASAPGREPVKLGGVVPPAENLRLELRPAATIRLRVVEPDGGGPVAGVEIGASRVAVQARFGPRSVHLDVRPDGDAFLLVGAGAERTEVTLSSPGRARQGFVLAGLPAGETRDEVVVLPREALLSGRVVDVVGAPVPRATVILSPPKELDVAIKGADLVTDEQGRFAAGGLAGGAWSLQAAADGYAPSAQQTVTTVADQAAEGVELVLSRGGTLQGRLLARDARMAAGREVQAVLDGPTGAASSSALASLALARKGAVSAEAEEIRSITYKTLADDLGEFVLDGLPDGEYRVTAWPGGESTARVAAGEVTVVELLLRTLPRIRGRVTSGGAPVEGADVTLGFVLGAADAAIESDIQRTNVAGEFDFTLDGTDACELWAAWKGARTRGVAVQPAWDTVHDVDLAFGGGVLQGVVEDGDDGTPVAAQVSITLAKRAGMTRDDAIHIVQDSDAQGGFRFELLEPGSWTLRVYKAGYDGATLEGLAVVAGETAAPLRVELRRGGLLELHVAAPKDRTARLLFKVTSLARPDWSREVHVSHGGTQTLDGVPPGEIRIEILRPKGPKEFEPFRAAHAVVELGRTTRFEETVTP